MNQLWLRDGSLVSSGFITPDSRFVFRSMSAAVYLMVQMSAGQTGTEPIMGIVIIICARKEDVCTQSKYKLSSL